MARVPKCLPRQAREEKIDFKAMNYIELIPIQIKATQEVHDKLAKLTRQNDHLKEEIKQLKNNKQK